jgi:hypothetical protein
MWFLKTPTASRSCISLPNPKIWCAVLLLLFPSFAEAEVVLNEIAWMGTPVEGVEAKQWWRYEWIELFNAGEGDVSLHGWAVQLYQKKLEWTIALSGVISAQGYFVAAASDKVAGSDLSYANLAGKFANSGQRVVLRNANGDIVEEVDARNGWPAGDNEGKYTMERWKLTDWGTSIGVGGTPGAENSIASLESLSEVEAIAPVVYQQKKDPFWSFFMAPQFGLAFALALVSAVLVLGLRRYLMRGVGSSGAQRG